ncbi:MAG: phosphate acyltransferase [Pseudomonadota bacterium]
MPDSALLSQLRQRSSSLKKRIIFTEYSDQRVREAIKEIDRLGLCEPIPMAPISGIELESFSERNDSASLLDQAAKSFAKSQRHKGLSEDEARSQLTDPLLLAAVLVKIGYADAGIAGAVESTAKVLRACLRGIGLDANSSLVSSVFLIDHAFRQMTFGDCAVNPQPDAEQLAQIAIDSAASHEALTGDTAKVALLSFSTLGSAQHRTIEPVRDALAIVRQCQPELIIDGELQLDAAIISDVAKAKAADSSVAGSANVLIFPDLNSANIGYKLAQRLGGATATGPILQGLAKPWLDLSRGCSTDDIINAAAIASVLAEKKLVEANE